MSYAAEATIGIEPTPEVTAANATHAKSVPKIRSPGVSVFNEVTPDYAIGAPFIAHIARTRKRKNLDTSAMKHGMVSSMNESRHIAPSLRRHISSSYSGKSEYVFLYLVYCRGYAKIGISASPKGRIASMQSGCPFPIETYGKYPLLRMQAVDAERAIFLALDCFHKNGEWFECPLDAAIRATNSVVNDYIPAVIPPRILRATSSRIGQQRGGTWRRISCPDGEFESMAAAARHCGITRQAALQRIQAGSAGWEYVNSA